jgi:hypothetical protein
VPIWSRHQVATLSRELIGPAIRDDNCPACNVNEGAHAVSGSHLACRPPFRYRRSENHERPDTWLS